MPKEMMFGYVYLGIFTASLAYSIYLVVRFRNQNAKHPAVFSKRHPGILVPFVMAVAVSSFVAGPLGIYGHMVKNQNFQIVSGVLLNQVFMMIIYDVFSLMWMVRYEIKLAQFATHRKWKLFLDEQYAQECWFVQHKTSLGRLMVVMGIGITIWLVFAVPYIVLQIMGKHIIGKMILVAQACPPLLLGLSVWRSTPAVTDVFHIRNQVSWLIKLTLFCIIMYGVLTWRDTDQMTTFYFGFMFSLLSPAFLFLLLDYPMRAYLKDQARMDANMLGSVSSTSASSLSRFTFSISSPGGNIAADDDGNKSNRVMRRRSSMGRQLLREILGSMLTFEMFMEHLMKEFSYENLLFIIEVTQFKQYLLGQFPELKKTPGVNHGLTVTLPDDIPNSVVIHDTTKSPLEKAKYIYDKYIDGKNAILEVNVAYQVRRDLASLFDASFSEDNWTPTFTPIATPRSSLPDSPDLVPSRNSSDQMIRVSPDIERINSDSRNSDTLRQVEWMSNPAELYSAFDDAHKQIFALLLDSLSRFRRDDKEVGFVG